MSVKISTKLKERSMPNCTIYIEIIAARCIEMGSMRSCHVHGCFDVHRITKEIIRIGSSS